MNVTLNKIKLQDIVISVMLLLSLLSGSGYMSQTILSLGIVLCCACLFIEDKLIYALPFIIFYNDFYGLVFGFSVLRIFTFMILARLLINMRAECKIKLQYLIPITIYFLFFATTISNYSIRRAVFGFIDVVCCMILAMSAIEDEKEYKQIFRIYTYVAFFAFVSGLLAGNFEMEGSQYTMEISRFNATFEDSNYMGFFYNVAIFSNVVLDLFKPRLKIFMIIVLEVMLLFSISMTAIIVNIVLWLLYVVVTKKIRVKSILLIAIVFFVVLNAYSYGLKNPDTPVLGQVSYRIDQKLNADDVDSFTTNRTLISKHNYEYFKSSTLFKRFLGGTSVNPIYRDLNIEAVSHNEYIDMLLNIGYIGTTIMMAFLLWRTLNIWSSYKKTNSKFYLSMFMNKSIWLFYGLALTMFSDYRFLFFFIM